MSDPYILHYAPDNASLVIRLTLEEMGLPYRTVLVDRSVAAQRAPDYLKLNPNGLIPVLETPQGALFETGAILMWLGEQHTAMLAPVASPARAHLIKWLFFVSNTLHADLRLLFYPQYYCPPDGHEGLRATVRGRLTRHLALLDHAAGALGWFDPDAPLVIDYYLACLIRWAQLYPVDAPRDWFDITATPTLRAGLTQLETRAATHAAQQAEGLGPTPFTSPRHAVPPEGSAL
ncbi:MAG: glutathione S-transferase family protein [Sedimentitalea sp.]